MTNTKYQMINNRGEHTLELKQEARELWQEAKELNLIFSKIFRGAK